MLVFVALVNIMNALIVHERPSGASIFLNVGLLRSLLITTVKIGNKLVRFHKFLQVLVENGELCFVKGRYSIYAGASWLSL